MRTRLLLLAGLLALAAGQAAHAQQRDQIRIVGSSTVFPFSTAVAESFGARTQYPTPVVESTGTGGGFRLFCDGVGTEYPDVSNASRRMQASEYERCRNNGVREITEVKFGFDGIVFGYADTGEPPLSLSLRELWLALAADVPADDSCSSFIANPARRWSDVDASLPPVRIEVFGPPPTSGTRDAFIALALKEGARSIGCMATLEAADPRRFDRLASRIREDGAWIDSGENDNAIVQTLVNSPGAFGVFGFSFLDQNSDRLVGARVDGVEPEFELIASGEYPISRSLFFYVKNQHLGLVSGLSDYVQEFVSEDAWGEFGYLTDRGLIPLLDDERDAAADDALALNPMREAPN
ncbi:substrate-binding domain-containing protein [Maricaulis sp.]|uniref:substrate-binding domain-containing protein n=1 Tax=Maricaulis sp. TaxID=1486257 RepID=UPI00261B6B51|nr:substrate-binding domain-containing protein [Maricaulis sp.]